MAKVRFRTHVAELLRPGPPHNQLLSPLVSYLSVFDGEPPETVRFPWEHREWLSRQRALRYAVPTASDDGLAPRRVALGELRDVVSGMIRAPQARPGATGPGGWTHLRLVLSPDELAALPFELLTGGGPEGIPLQVDPARPTVITRSVRLGAVAPSSLGEFRPPRVLFVVGDRSAYGEVPYEAHAKALHEALRPWCPPKGDGSGPDYEPVCTVLRPATLDRVARACQERDYTHVHLLAHGAPLDADPHAAFGVVLAREGSGVDVISGERLASALRSTRADGSRAAPQVVTLATCDSNNRGSVVVPGAGVAQRLHAAGIPLVLGSQFPLSTRGATVLVAQLYRGLLGGEHPLVVLAATREALYRQETDTHDWASMVVYAHVPADLDDRVDTARLKGIFKRIKIWNQWIDRLAEKGRVEEVRRELGNLEAFRAELAAREDHPAGEAYAERHGLEGSACKRAAQAVFFMASREQDEALREQLRAESRHLLAEALESYRRGADGRLPEHWNAVQYLVLRYLFTGTLDADDQAFAAYARVCAERDQSRERWGVGSLIELDLLAGQKDPSALAARWAQIEDPENRHSTLDQLRRYRDWWGKPEAGLPGGEALAIPVEQLLARIDPPPR